MASWIFYTTLLASFLLVTPLQLVDRGVNHDDRADEDLNNRPIIGILAQELSYTMQDIYADTNYSSYIAASYVKYLEGAGARVVPIWINQDKLYYDNLLDSINGVLLPGGAVWFNNTAGYGDAGAMVMAHALQLNQRGDFFPVWGTCLGYELMFFLAAPSEPRISCYAQNMSLPLDFKTDYLDSKMYRSAPKEILDILSTKNVTANFHSYCITEDTLSALGMDQDWHVLSTNRDVDGIEFISTVESRTLPFYGIQFHPEKNGYEFKATKNIPHTRDAVLVMQYFADFFVAEARKNHHSFPTAAEEHDALISTYTTTYTGDRLSYEQLYFFC